MTTVRTLPTFLVLAAALGCAGGNPNAPANVSGSVKYNGKPLTGGAVHFHSADGPVYTADISPDGTYSITDLPKGDLSVTVDTEVINPNAKPEEAKGEKAKKTQEARMQMSGGGRQPPPGYGPAIKGEYVKIPAKYAKAQTSGLKVTLSRGTNTYNIDLTD